MQQPFLPNGNLTPGIHIYKMEEFEQQFVNEFPNSIRGPMIYDFFKNWIKLLLYVLPPRYVWLDGSYLTKKMEPNDIDLVVFYYPEDIINEQQADAIDQLVHRISRSYACDAYICFSFEHWSKEQLGALQNQDHKIMQTYWMGQFGFDQLRNPKGIVQLNQTDLFSIVELSLRK
ncbi:conserved hypothetical protein [[Clostridium] ultunense Esp]|nr:conserved hypothetical protein [[Clostridium] ultunense Esp]